MVVLEKVFETVINDIPRAFWITDAVLEFFANLSALLLTFLSLKAYKFTSERKYGFFSLAFGLISISFIARSLIHIMLYLNLKNQAIFNLASFYGVTSYIALLLTAYLLLLVLSLEFKNKKIISLLYLLSFFTVFTSQSPISTFNIVSVIILAFITIHFYEIFIIKGRKSSLAVFFAFLLIALSHFSFVLSDSLLFFLMSHLLQTLAFIVLFLNNLILLYGNRKIINLISPNKPKNELKKKQTRNNK